MEERIRPSALQDLPGDGMRLFRWIAWRLWGRRRWLKAITSVSPTDTPFTANAKKKHRKWWEEE